MASPIASLFGPILIGIFFNTILYGVLVVQCFIYFQTYKKEVAWIRYFVLFLFILETMNTAFDMYVIYEPLVQNYGSDRTAVHIPLLLPADPMVTVTISTAVQIFIAWRIKVISGSKLLMATIVFFSLTSFGGGIATMIFDVRTPEYAKLEGWHGANGAVISWFGSSAIADLIITPSLIWSLYIRRTGIKATDDKVNRIMRLTLQTGLITALAATCSVILFLTVPTIAVNYVFSFALSKLYTNSLLSTLNARAGWGNLTGGTTNQPNALFSEVTAPSKRSGTGASVTTAVFELESQSTPSQIAWGPNRALGKKSAAKAMEHMDETSTASVHPIDSHVEKISDE